MGTGSTVSQDRPAVDIALLVVRVVAGVIFAAHGAQKLFGAFGGPGLAAMVQPPPNGMGLLGYPVTIGEFFGGLGLIVGFLCRFSAAALIVIMIGAIAQVHAKNGFFLQNGGFEYNLALIGLLAAVLIAGPGRYAVGRFLPLPTSARMMRWPWGQNSTAGCFGLAPSTSPGLTNTRNTVPSAGALSRHSCSPRNACSSRACLASTAAWARLMPAAGSSSSNSRSLA